MCKTFLSSHQREPVPLSKLKSWHPLFELGEVKAIPEAKLEKPNSMQPVK
jgi:hypothetical protein